MARIERLPEDPRRLLQTASVLGRVVPLAALRAMCGEDEDLSPQLQELQRLEFIYPQRSGEDLAYVFKHTLTQEVAYGSLLPHRSRELHAAAGRALERLYAGRLADAYDPLAYHLS